MSAGAALRDLLDGDECLSVAAGRLRIEEADVADLARRFGTPLYVISEAQLRRNARRFVEAFGAAWTEGEVLIMPSIKANYSLALRRILNEEGTGCDTFGAGELEAALRSGVEPRLVSLNGPSKSAELVEQAVRGEVRITLDSLAELEMARAAGRRLGKSAKVRLRLRPWLDLATPTELFDEPISIQLATQRYKPGIPTEQLLALPVGSVVDPALEVVGLTAHIGRQGRDPAIWGELGEWVGSLAGELGEIWDGWKPREIDLGGGFPVPRDPFGLARLGEASIRPLAPALELYAESIANGLRRGLAAGNVDPAGICLEVEPGRSLYGNAGIHLASVRDVKSQKSPIPYTWIETDTSEVFLADVVFERNRWNVLVAERVEEPASVVGDVVGISCNPDVIVPRAELPGVGTGDVLAFLDTGAYQDVNANNFNALPRPGTVLVNGAEADWIKRGESRDDPLSRDLIPSRLRGGEIAVIGLDHVSVTCDDLDRSLAFYAALLGIPLIDRGESSDDELGAITGLADAVLRWADLDLGEGRVLELLEYRSPPAGRGASGFHNTGQGHFSLRVADADVAHAALERAGVEVRSSPVAIEAEGHWRGCRCFYASDPDGMTVELIERPPPASGWPGPIQRS
ncbi:MAG: VOC family protein [Solirubrobacterales bacterium]